jgi:EAL domain-containing protein (putative c-di-GMP-specific phosphodiesterase class I)
MSNLVSYVYNSAAAVDFTQDNLVELLEESRNKNAVYEITGILLFVDQCFFQILEGPAERIDSLVQLIHNDARHTKITTIMREPVARRSFSAWTMGFAQVSNQELGQIDGLNDFFTGQKVLTDIDAGRAKKLLQAFSQGRWRVKLTSAPGRTVRLRQPAHKVESILSSRPEFSFAFQPVIDAENKAVSGYEAQLRGVNGEPAEQVIQQLALEEVSDFDAEARRMAVGQAHRLGLTSTLYLTMVMQSSDRAPNNISSTLETARHCGIDPNRIVLLLKHEMALADPQSIAEWLLDFRRMGLRIGIRDFGSGHAGLALLEHYQPEMISLGSWLIRGIEENGARQAIIRGVLQTCGDLGIEVLARGVKTVEEFSWLTDEGVDLYQGDLFAKSGVESLPRPLLPLREPLL